MKIPSKVFTFHRKHTVHGLEFAQPYSVTLFTVHVVVLVLDTVFTWSCSIRLLFAPKTEMSLEKRAIFRPRHSKSWYDNCPYTVHVRYRNTTLTVVFSNCTVVVQVQMRNIADDKYFCKGINWIYPDLGKNIFRIYGLTSHQINSM